MVNRLGKALKFLYKMYDTRMIQLCYSTSALYCIHVYTVYTVDTVDTQYSIHDVFTIFTYMSMFDDL